MESHTNRAVGKLIGFTSQYKITWTLTGFEENFLIKCQIKNLKATSLASPGKLGRLDLSLLEILDHRTAQLALAVCTRCPDLELITGQPPLGRVVFIMCITVSILWCELNSPYIWQVLFLVELWHCMRVKSGLFQLRNTATPHHRCPVSRIRVSD